MKITPQQRRRVNAGFYRRSQALTGIKLWLAFNEWAREINLDYARKRERRTLTPRPRVRNICVSVPCPPWQEVTLTVLPLDRG